MTERANRFPGTDEKTGWPLTPETVCPQGETASTPNQVCHLSIAAIGGPPIQCCYHPPACCFYGHYPVMGDSPLMPADGATGGDNRSGGSERHPTTSEATPAPKQERMI